jgi:hypothetical protein
MFIPVQSYMQPHAYTSSPAKINITMPIKFDDETLDKLIEQY